MPRRFHTLYERKFSNVRPLLSITFPKGFQIKNIGHPTLGSGGKKMVKRYLKSEQTQTHTQTDTHTHTDKSTYRKHRPRGPEGRCFENLFLTKTLFLQTT